MNTTILDLKKELIKSRRDLSNELRDVLAFHRSSVAELRKKSTSLDKAILKLRTLQNENMIYLTKELRPEIAKVRLEEKHSKR